MNEKHEANRRKWDVDAEPWRELRDRDGLLRRLPTEPDLAFQGDGLGLIEEYVGDLAGREACVIGSGDNYAAFALAGLGMTVTSVDISQRQLDVASDRAAELGLTMRFVRADAADMSQVPDSSFDLVCSTNGFFVWIADVPGVFGQVARILRPGGHYIFYDIHPFQRPWKDKVTALEMIKDYWTTGPLEDEKAGTYEFNWTLSDLLNPLVDAGLTLRQLRESPASDARFYQGASYEPGADCSLLDWRTNPCAGLPVWLTVVAQRP